MTPVTPAAQKEVKRMEAGRELDALISEMISGELYPQWKVGGETIKPKPGHWCGSTVIAETKAVSEGLAMEPIYPPQYSTDVVAAWGVINHLIEKGWLPQLEFSSKRGGYWDVCLGHMILDAIYTRAETAPHAICLAALKALSPPPRDTGGKA